jgi:hypothetical protein
MDTLIVISLQTSADINPPSARGQRVSTSYVSPGNYLSLCFLFFLAMFLQKYNGGRIAGC